MARVGPQRHRKKKSDACYISWGLCSLIRILVLISIVVVLVLLFIRFPVDGVEVGRCSCPLVLCNLLLLSVLDRLRLV